MKNSDKYGKCENIRPSSGKVKNSDKYGKCENIRLSRGKVKFG